MNVLIAGESSGATRDAFIAMGHNAMSCDLLETEVQGPHYKGDVRDVLPESWDLLIAHPTCTYLSSSGLHWNKRPAGIAINRAGLTEDAIKFARMFIDGPETAHIPKRGTENPIGCLSTRVRRPDQIIQPHQFGDDASKATCLWLHGLPKLIPTCHVPPRMVCCGQTLPNGVGKYGCPNCCGEKTARPRWANQTDSGQNKLGPSDDRWRLRSKTYPGIAAAWASQWGSV